MPSPILRQIDLPNAVTLVGLAIGALSALLSIQGRPELALMCLVLAGLADLCDGPLARRARDRSELRQQVGKHLDSLVDMSSFGVVPLVFAYCWGLRSPAEVALLLVFLAAGATRLAYFNSAGMEEDSSGRSYFTGLPITYSALLVPTLFATSRWVSPATERGLLIALYLGMALAMVSPFRMPKPRGLGYLFFFAGALVLLAFYGWAAFAAS